MITKKKNNKKLKKTLSKTLKQQYGSGFVDRFKSFTKSFPSKKKTLRHSIQKQEPETLHTKLVDEIKKENPSYSNHQVLGELLSKLNADKDKFKNLYGNTESYPELKSILDPEKHNFTSVLFEQLKQQHQIKEKNPEIDLKKKLLNSQGKEIKLENLKEDFDGLSLIKANITTEDLGNQLLEYALKESSTKLTGNEESSNTQKTLKQKIEEELDSGSGSLTSPTKKTLETLIAEAKKKILDDYNTSHENFVEIAKGQYKNIADGNEIDDLSKKIVGVFDMYGSNLGKSTRQNLLDLYNEIKSANFENIRDKLLHIQEGVKQPKTEKEVEVNTNITSLLSYKDDNFLKTIAKIGLSFQEMSILQVAEDKAYQLINKINIKPNQGEDTKFSEQQKYLGKEGHRSAMILGLLKDLHNKSQSQPQKKQNNTDKTLAKISTKINFLTNYDIGHGLDEAFEKYKQNNKSLNKNSQKTRRHSGISLVSNSGDSSTKAPVYNTNTNSSNEGFGFGNLLNRNQRFFGLNTGKKTTTPNSQKTRRNSGISLGFNSSESSTNTNVPVYTENPNKQIFKEGFGFGNLLSSNPKNISKRPPTTNPNINFTASSAEWMKNSGLHTRESNA